MMIKKIFVSFLALLIWTPAFSASLLPKLKIDQSQITLSGFSSGGYMAVQLHVAYSNTFKGVGVIAGGPMRAIFVCAGIHDVVAKSVGTSNPYNMVAATFSALKSLTSPKLIAEKRSKDISEIIRRRNLALGNKDKKND